MDKPRKCDFCKNPAIAYLGMIIPQQGDEKLPRITPVLQTVICDTCYEDFDHVEWLKDPKNRKLLEEPLKERGHSGLDFEKAEKAQVELKSGDLLWRAAAEGLREQGVELPEPSD